MITFADFYKKIICTQCTMKNDNVLYTQNYSIKNSKMITYRTSKMITLTPCVQLLRSSFLLKEAASAKRG